jgi:hypothetical protein
LVEGCFSSFPYGTCLLSVSVAYKLTNHQYLAFDVSLPPPKYLSCSPKQLDSVIIWLIVNNEKLLISANVTVTLYGDDKSQKLLSSPEGRLSMHFNYIYKSFSKYIYIIIYIYTYIAMLQFHLIVLH